jgi:thiamine kinase-like enzyme
MSGTEAADDGRLGEALARATTGLGLAPGTVPLIRARLGGLTNENYLIEAAGERLVLRLPGAGTADYIDRAAEEQAARATAAVGVNAEVVLFDPTDGLQLCRFIESGTTMSAAAFRNEDRIRRAAIALRTVHREAVPFRARFECLATIRDYAALLARRNATLPDGYAQAQAQAERVRDVLAAHPGPLAPCHCDPLAENFIDTGTVMHVVDWEYAGNNDPMWDLGDLAVEAAFDAGQEAALLDSYFDGRVPDADRARMVLYKAMCDLLWSFWGVIQHINDNPAEDFWAYAIGRLARCRTLMASDEFAAALQDAARR